MNIKFSNGTELSCIVVAGGPYYVYGVPRDALTFVFPADAGMEELDALFVPANCESVTIEGDDGSAFIHKGYTVRGELSKASVEVEPGTAETEAVYEDRITVVMAQRTYVESQMANMEAAMAALAGKEV